MNPGLELINIEIIKIIIALVGTGFATYFDIFNKRNIPDILVYSFLIIALIVGFIAPVDMYMNIILGIIVFSVCYLFYRMGHIGGADVYILAGLAILLAPPASFIPINFYSPLIGSIMLFMSLIILSGIFFAGYAIIRYCIPAIKKTKKIKKKRLTSIIGLLIALVIFLTVISTLSLFSIWYYLMFIYLMVLASMFMYFKEEIKNGMIEKISLNKIDNEDIIAIENMDPKEVKRYNIPKIITLKDIKRLKKTKIKKLPVYTKMPPFLPFIMIGLILTILVGDVFAYLVSPILF